MRPINAIKWTLTSQAVRGVLHLLQLLILANILGPSQYGLVALAVALTSFALLFSDLGLTAAYIQSQNISTEQRNTLFTYNILFAATISTLIYAAAPIISSILNKQEIEELITLSAPIILLTALGQQVRASAEKSLAFRPVAIIEIIGSLVGFLTTVTLANSDVGAVSIIWGSLTYAVTISALPWIFLPGSMKPGIGKSLRIETNYIAYGINTVLNGILTNLTLNIDLFLGSRTLSEAALGSYSLPRNLILQVQAIANPPLNKASFPIFAKSQQDSQKTKELFKSITNITTTLNTPLYLTLIFYAEPIVTMAFSAAWSQSIYILQILAIWGIMRTCLNPPGTLLLALNKTKTLRSWNLLVLATTALTVLLVTPHGATLTAASLTVLTIIQVMLVWPTLLRNNTTVNIKEYFVEMISPIIIGVSSFGIINLISPFDRSNASILVAQIAISITIYLAMCIPRITRSLTILYKKPT